LTHTITRIWTDKNNYDVKKNDKSDDGEQQQQQQQQQQNQQQTVEIIVVTFVNPYDEQEQQIVRLLGECSNRFTIGFDIFICHGMLRCLVGSVVVVIVVHFIAVVDEGGTTNVPLALSTSTPTTIT
jgi:hypothetical protein